MKPFKNLCIFETFNVGICFQFLNQIPIERSDLILEISPTPAGGILILQSNDEEEIVNQYALFKSLFNDQIFDSALIKNIHPSLVLSYLSQSTAQIKNQMIVLETKTLSQAFIQAQKVTEDGAEAIDFRCLRSTVHKTIVYLVTSNKTNLVSNQSITFIDKVEKHLKNYFGHD